MFLHQHPRSGNCSNGLLLQTSLCSGSQVDLDHGCVWLGRDTAEIWACTSGCFWNTAVPLKPTWGDTREKPWHPVQQLASYPQLATEVGVNPEWDLQQLLGSLQDHATAVSSLNYYFYFIYDLCGLTVWVCVPRGMCGGQGQFMSLVLFLHLSTFMWVPGIKLRWSGLHYEGGKQLPIISQDWPCCWITRLQGRVLYVTPWG